MSRATPGSGGSAGPLPPVDAAGLDLGEDAAKGDAHAVDPDGVAEADGGPVDGEDASADGTAHGCLAGQTRCEGNAVAVCGPDQETWTVIATCPVDQACTNGKCCTPDCEGRACGPDGCGGSCGTCGPGLACEGGACVCNGSCAGRACGDDGCGNLCGVCDDGELCVDGQCVCQPDCEGRACGPDGCGGSCGTCGAGQVCQGGACISCTPSCAGKSCGSDGCGGSCGTCEQGQGCSQGACVDCLAACGLLCPTEPVICTGFCSLGASDLDCMAEHQCNATACFGFPFP